LFVIALLFFSLGLVAVTRLQKTNLPKTASISKITAIIGGMIIDGTGNTPTADGVILIEGGKIVAIGTRKEISVPDEVAKVDAAGKYVIPGLIDGNVHFMFGISVENLARHEGHYEDLIEESSQVALKSGVTTAFDTWGPLRPLMNVRDRINSGEIVGSRLFVAGNIIGFSGPLGRDFIPDSSASKMFAKKINAIWEENVGPELGYMTPDEVGLEVRKYISRGPDFLKYGSSGHIDAGVLLFSEQAQKAIVEEGHEARLTVQCHTSNVESLRIAIEAGVDMITHCDITEYEAIPESTISKLKEKQISCGVLPDTTRGDDANLKRSAGNPLALRSFRSRLLNITQLIQAGVPLVMTTDAFIWSPEVVAEMAPEDKMERLDTLGKGHFFWCRAMAEKGMPAMDIILAATRNVAAAYHELDQIGTLEKGKVADLVILEANPLEDINNLQKIVMVMKDGQVIDRDRLPIKKVVEPAEF
jgi:imidazolonepropionase-like amidohydrolase